MFKLVLVCSLVLATVAFTVDVHASRVSCQISGDPHYTTWDRVHHDFQGKGVWELLSPTTFIPPQGKITVQSQFIPCNIGAWYKNPPKRVTCIRSIAVRIEVSTGRSTLTTTVKWGSAGSQPAFPANPPYYNATDATPAVTDLVQITGEGLISGCNAGASWESECSHTRFQSTPVDILGGAYTLSYVNGYLVLSSKTAVDPVVFKWRRYTFLGYLPAGEFYMGYNGLCGYYDMTCNREFVFKNGTDTSMVGQTKCNSRYNNAVTNEWGATFAVDSGSSIMSTYHHEIMGFETMSLPADAVPDDTVQKSLDQVEFTNLQQVQEINAACAGAPDQFSKEDCVYDAGALNGVQDAGLAAALAQSNIAVAEEAQLEEANANNNAKGSTNKEGVTAAIVVGCVCAVALVAVGVTYARLRRTRQQLSQALILSGSAGSGVGMEDQGTSGEIRLSDNL